MSQSSSSTATHLGIVAETYARGSLYDAAKGNRELTQVRDEVSSIATILDDMPQLASVFDNRTIDHARRAKSIKKIFGKQVSETTLNFLYVLNDKNRLNEIRRIAIAFDRLDKAERGQVDVDVFTAVRLSREQLDEVAERIGNAIGQKAVVTQQLDESLIGGLKVRIGDKLIDASVASQLRRISQKLVASGREGLRTVIE